MRWKTIFSLAAFVMVCEGKAQNLPPFLQQLIEEYETASEERFPLEIWRYEYEGESVFYIPLSRVLCCDLFSVLYNAKGEVICRPDGGFTGRGDGRCPDFDRRASEGVLVWGPQRERLSESSAANP